MRKIHILSKNNKLEQELKDLSDSLHYYETWNKETLDQLTHNPENLILLDWEFATSLSGQFQAPLCLLANLNTLSATEEKLVEELAHNERRIQGIIDTSNKLSYAFPMLRHLASPNSSSWRNLGEDLGHFVGYTLSELQRIKKLHEQIVPMRNENIKGLKVLSKFAAGESAGGEFFDIIRGDQEFVLLLTSSKSYVISSIILSHFETLRGKKNFGKEDLKDFLTALSAEIISNGNFSEDDLELFISKVDLKTMKMEGFHFGHSALISNQSNHVSGNEFPVSMPFFDRAFFEFKLDRGEKMLLLSPGVRLNCNDIMDGQEVFGFIKNHFEKGAKGLVNEIFYQLKKDASGDFLSHDASAIYIEVDSNVIVQV